MTGTPARYLDGATSRERPVRVRFTATGRVHLEGLEPALSFDLADLAVQPRLGDTPRAIDLPGGARLEVDDNDAVDAALREDGRGRGQRLVHALEQRRTWVAAAVVLTLLAAFAVTTRGAPWLAERATRALPAGVLEASSAQALAAMDRMAFSPTGLTAPERSRVEGLFQRVARGAPGPYRFRLVFRDGGEVGANAFALPDGEVVVTDALVRMASDPELMGVLAHEVGHVVHRHALRQVLQDSVATVLIGAVTGDVVSTSTVAAGLPVALLQAHHSRRFETEADTYALEWMRANGVPPRAFADLLTRLDQDPGGAVPAYLSSHPPTAERIARFMADPAP